MIKNLTACVCVILLLSQTTFAQETDFAKLMHDPAATFYDVQNAFNNYNTKMQAEHKKEEKWYKRWRKKDSIEEEESGYELYKRWEYFMRDRIDASGKMPDPSITYTEWLKYHPQNNNNASQNKLNGNNQVLVTNTWSYAGPVNGEPTGGGTGRLACIRFDPTNSNTIYVGSPAGGLWKSTNSGQTWSTTTDALSVIGIADVAIDPTNTNVMYLATGDRDATDTYSTGILKSTNGGITWNTTGFSYNVNQTKTIGSILINPNNTNILIIATSTGIYRSIDAGMNWQLQKAGNFKDLKFKPGHPNTVYAAGSSFIRSNDGGVTWVPSTVTGSIGRMAIAVTAADSNYVYILAGQTSALSYGFDGIYRSTNGGVTFTKMCSTPNILGWNSTGTDSGGQGWYDLSIAASPTNKDNIVTGGVNIWKSTNGGTTMTLMAHWTGSGAPYVHADVHALEFLPGSGTTVLAGCDGGLFRTTNSGTSWADIGKSSTGQGLAIGQMYRLSVSQTNANLTMTGWQDNGCSLHNAATATRVLGGDGMEVLIDYSTSNNMYGEQYNGNIWKSTNGGGSFNTNVAGTGGTGVDEDGDWVTPYIIHPTAPNTLLVGKVNIYRSTNGGTSFSTLTLPNTNPSAGVVALAYAPSNPNYIYAAKGGEFQVSTNGSTFTNLSANLPTGSITYICVDPANPQRLWITASGYSIGNNLFYSPDAGQSWTNVSLNLPGVPLNTIVYQAGSNDGLYVGSDIGVFYKDNTLSSWILYSSGLPNVIVKELEIQVSTGKLRAATYGRGLWETGLYTTPTNPPAAAFSSNKTTVCKNGAINFYDNSTNFPSSWTWTFGGGTPATSTVQFPTVTYSAAGTYPVQLVATNAAGSDSLIQTTYVTVLAPPTVYAGLDQHICKGDTAQLNATGGTTYTWSPVTSLNSSQISNPYTTTAATKNYTVTVGDANGCTATDAVTIFVTVPPALPAIGVIQPDSLYATTNNVNYQWYLGGVLIPGATSQHIEATGNGTYSVVVSDTAGCGFSTSSSNFNYVGIAENTLQQGLSVYPNPSKGNFDVVMNSTSENNYTLKIYNPLGACIYSEMVYVTSGSNKKSVSINLPSGAYILELVDVKNKQKAIKKLSIINP